MAAMSADMRGNTDETWSRTLDWWARPCHHPQARAHDGRRRDGNERAGQGFGLYGAPTGGREHIKAITCRADEVIE